MGKFIDLTGKRFGKLTVIERDCDKNNLTHWVCKCDCGATKSVRGQHLRNGLIVSCGCYAKLASAQAKTKKNKIEICKNYAKVYLSNSNKVCIIDIEDVEKIKNYCWALNPFGYATTHISTSKRLLMHRLICNVGGKKGYGAVDHINHDKLDNRKRNLRFFETNTLNLHNLNPYKTRSKTGIMNIYLKRDKYQVRYQRFGHQFSVGTFKDLETAKQALYKSIKENNFIHGEVKQ